jgi:signal transduction histidine kinase
VIRARHFFITYVIPYGIGLSVVAFSLFASHHLQPVIGKSFLFLVLGAIVFSAWCGGLEAGLTCLALGVLGTKFFLLSPTWSFRTAATQDLMSLGLFLVVGFEGVWLMTHRHRLWKQEPTKIGASRQVASDPTPQLWDSDMLESLPDASIVLDHEWRCINLNEKAAALWKKHMDDLVGTPLEDVLGKEAWNSFSIECWRAIDEHVPRRFEYHDKHSGQWLACHAYPEKDRLMVCLRDVSAAKWAEKTLPPMESDLNPRPIEQRTQLEVENRKLVTQVQELAQVNAELERLAYISFHDLQEPLRMAIISLELLKNHDNDRRDTVVLDYITSALDAALSTHALIQDLAVYAEVGSREKKCEPVDCEKLLDLTVAKMRVAIEASGVVISHDPLPTVFADGVQLGQVFQNLIDNSIKFRGEAPPYVHVSAKGEGREWVFFVNDNGMGMESQYLKQIFMIHRRLPAAEHRPGTGTGLAICMKIVQRHGGRIWAESQPGEGATVYFTIPMDAGRTPAVSRP